MTIGGIYIGGLVIVTALCALCVTVLSGVRCYVGYKRYVTTGKISEFDVLSEAPFDESHPVAIVIDVVFYMIFCIIFSAVWPLTAIITAGCGAAWLNRKGYLKLHEKDRIMSKLNGDHLKG